MGILLVIFVAIAAIVFFLAMLTSYQNLSHWHHTFDNTKFSTQEFYKALATAIEARGIPNLQRKRITYQERFVLGAAREYARVSRGQYVFDVCASPFGTGMYVSWWLVEETTALRRILLSIRMVAYFMKVKTYHEIDSEKMFRDLAHIAVLEAIGAMTETGGTRSLVTPEAAIQDYRNVRISA